jgi:hypothetical protein
MYSQNRFAPARGGDRSERSRHLDLAPRSTQNTLSRRRILTAGMAASVPASRTPLAEGGRAAPLVTARCEALARRVPVPDIGAPVAVDTCIDGQQALTGGFHDPQGESGLALHGPRAAFFPPIPECSRARLIRSKRALRTTKAPIPKN